MGHASRPTDELALGAPAGTLAPVTSAPPPFPPPHYPGKRRRRDGMTWTALIVLLLLIPLLGWNIYTWYDARTPPAGVQVTQATVEDVTDPSRPRPSARKRVRNYLLVEFSLPDGETGEARYEERFFGAEPGDTLSVYREGDEWRTTSEESPWGALFSGLGILVMLLMVFGWFKVRRESASSGPSRTPASGDGPGGISA